MKIPTESQEAQAAMHAIQIMGEPYTWIFHVPNGGRRSVITAARLKAEGVKAGVSDYLYLRPRGKYHGLCIELKAGNGRHSNAQIEFLARANQEGYLGVIAYGWQALIEILTAYEKLGAYDGEKKYLSEMGQGEEKDGSG